MIAAAALLAVSALWAIAFVHGVYGHTNTRIEASEWIDEHVPDGSVLSLEGWDDGLPLGLPGIDQARWEHQQFDLFGPDDEEKVERLATQLGGVDYVVESSPRVWRTVTRLPARYPSSINFFEGLDDGSLGFERVATFTSPPRLGPFRLDDGWAEEAFSVYDHPEVRIWQRVRDVPRADVLEVLDLDAAATALPVHPEDGHANGTLLHPDEAAANRGLPTYDDTFDRGHAWWHALGWLVLLMLAAGAAWVLLLPVLGRLPDAGAGLAPLVGIAGPALVLFSIVSWTPIELGRPLVAATFAAWLGLGGWFGWRRRAAIAVVWRERRALVLAGQVAVLVAFAGALLLRAANPDLWHPARGGEKVFELTFLTSVMRTRTLPPPDPWFSGGAINYYYGGWFLASLPGRLLRTSPSVAIQLVLPLFAAAAAGAASSAAAALARAPRPPAGRDHRPDRRARARQPGHRSGVVGATSGRHRLVGAVAASSRRPRRSPSSRRGASSTATPTRTSWASPSSWRRWRCRLPRTARSSTAPARRPSCWPACSARPSASPG